MSKEQFSGIDTSAWLTPPPILPMEGFVGSDAIARQISALDGNVRRCMTRLQARKTITIAHKKTEGGGEGRRVVFYVSPADAQHVIGQIEGSRIVHFKPLSPGTARLNKYAKDHGIELGAAAPAQESSMQAQNQVAVSAPAAASSPTVFNFNDDPKNPVRVVWVDGVKKFVGKDVCDRLGYLNHNNAMKDHCRGVSIRYPIPDAIGRMQEVRVLDRADVYRLIANSTLPAAEAFEKWLYEKVLPEIADTGGYGVKVAPKLDLRDLSTVQNLLAQALNEQQGSLLKIAELQPKADALKVIADSTGLFTIRQAAKLLGVAPEVTLRPRLRAAKWIYKENGAWVPSGDAIAANRATTKVRTFSVGTNDEGQDESRSGSTLYLTAKGVVDIARKMSIELNDESRAVLGLDPLPRKAVLA